MARPTQQPATNRHPGLLPVMAHGRVVDVLDVRAAVDPCPKGDPECETGDDGSCHDACEAPRSRYPGGTVGRGVPAFNKANTDYVTRANRAAPSSATEDR